jgi:hypothetical protein
MSSRSGLLGTIRGLVAEPPQSVLAFYSDAALPYIGRAATTLTEQKIPDAGDLTDVIGRTVSPFGLSRRVGRRGPLLSFLAGRE